MTTAPVENWSRVLACWAANSGLGRRLANWPELPHGVAGARVDAQQDGFFESSWEAMPHEILLSGGEPCGSLCVEDCSDHVHLHELVLKPDCQGMGMGSAVLHLANPAASLYRRVGFREVGTTNTHLLFEWSDADETSTILRRACPPALSPRDETAPL